MTPDTDRMGISGRIARFFLDSQLTPLLALVLMLAGAFAVAVTPREEEPQIDVTMAHVLVPFPGASAEDVEQLVAIPAEQVLSQIQGLEHVWSVSRPGQAVITVQYKVGVKRTEAIVRLHDAILSHRDWLPPELGVGEPLVKPKGIDDVPIVSITLWTRDPGRGAFDLERIAHAVEAELKRVPGTMEVSTVGGPGRVGQVEIDVDKPNAHGLSAGDLVWLQIAGHEPVAQLLWRGSDGRIFLFASCADDDVWPLRREALRRLADQGLARPAEPEPVARGIVGGLALFDDGTGAT